MPTILFNIGVQLILLWLLQTHEKNSKPTRISVDNTSSKNKIRQSKQLSDRLNDYQNLGWFNDDFETLGILCDISQKLDRCGEISLLL